MSLTDAKRRRTPVGKPSLETLQFYDCTDLPPYLVHPTKNTKEDDLSALDNLIGILKTGEICGSSRSGYIKRPNKADCFMGVPSLAPKVYPYETNANEDDSRYKPHGLCSARSSETTLSYRLMAAPRSADSD